MVDIVTVVANPAKDASDVIADMLIKGSMNMSTYSIDLNVLNKLSNVHCFDYVERNINGSWVKDDLSAVVDKIMGCRFIFSSASITNGQLCSQYRILEDRLAFKAEYEQKPELLDGKKFINVVTCHKIDSDVKRASKLMSLNLQRLGAERVSEIIFSDEEGTVSPSSDQDLKRTVATATLKIQRANRTH